MWVPQEIADNVAQVLEAVLTSSAARILHRNRDRQEKRRFGFHPALSIPGLRPLQQFFHPFAMFADGTMNGTRTWVRNPKIFRV